MPFCVLPKTRFTIVTPASEPDVTPASELDVTPASEPDVTPASEPGSMMDAGSSPA